MVTYILKHKNTDCGVITFDEKQGRIVSYKDFGAECSPFFGTCDADKIKKWWETRTVPASRSLIQKLVKEHEYLNSEMYLAKNLALSMSDTYWICPAGSGLTYEDVNFRNFAPYNNGKVPYHRSSSYDLNASLGGQMEKYWDLTQDVPVLVKECYQYHGQQAVNEVFATVFHKMQETDIPFVKYTGEIVNDEKTICKCQAFTSDRVELISAYEVLESESAPNDISKYDAFIRICENHGIPVEQMQRFMDYQTVSDFLMTNTDRHLLNFAVLRDADTMKLIGPAPIFDTGNSMFFSEHGNCAQTRAGILDREITALCKSEEKMMAKVANRNIVDLEKLPTSDFIINLYVKAGIAEEKATAIAHNFAIKRDLVNEFQHGQKISLYNEKIKEQQNAVHPSGTTFCLVCGLPDSGKTELAKKVITELSSGNKPEKSSENLFPVSNIDENDIIINKERILATVTGNTDYRGSVINISTNEIRREMQEEIGYIDNDIVFLVAEARIKAALLSGADVVFTATALDREFREQCCKLADSCGVAEKRLVVAPVESQKANHPDISEECYRRMAARLQSSTPSENEGWDEVIFVATPKVKDKEIGEER